MLPWLILVKWAINWGLAIYYIKSSHPATVMFFGIGIADLGTLWTVLEYLK